MCSTCSECFSEDEKARLKNKEWTNEEINFAEHSIIEDKIKKLINKNE